MLELLLGDLLPWLIGIVAGIGGVLFYGSRQRRAGKAEAELDRREDDAREAARTRERLKDAADRNDGAGDPVDRLRDKGRLRD